jgi:hypothetical protein
MALHIFRAPTAHVSAYAEFASDHSSVYDCTDGSVFEALASLSGRSSAAMGLFVELSDFYGGNLVARDIASLSQVVRIDHVVLSAPQYVKSHAVAVRRLLTGEVVRLRNRAVQLDGAYCRPAPPRAIKVWVLDGAQLVSGELSYQRQEGAQGFVESVETFL